MSREILERNRTVLDAAMYANKKNDIIKDDLSDLLKIGKGHHAYLEFLEHPSVFFVSESKHIKPIIMGGDTGDSIKKYLLARYGFVVYSILYGKEKDFAKYLQSFDRLKRSVKYYYANDTPEWAKSLFKDFNKLFRRGKMHFHVPLEWDGSKKSALDFLKHIESDKRRRIKKESPSESPE